MWSNGGVETQKNNDKDVSITNLNERSRLTNFLTNSAQVLNVFVCINLVPAQAGKVTIGLKSHRPCVTDNSGTCYLRAHGLRKGDEHPAYTPVEYDTLYLFNVLAPLSLKK